MPNFSGAFFSGEKEHRTKAKIVPDITNLKELEAQYQEQVILEMEQQGGDTQEQVEEALRRAADKILPVKKTGGSRLTFRNEEVTASKQSIGALQKLKKIIQKLDVKSLKKPRGQQLVEEARKYTLDNEDWTVLSGKGGKRSKEQVLAVIRDMIAARRDTWKQAIAMMKKETMTAAIEAKRKKLHHGGGTGYVKVVMQGRTPYLEITALDKKHPDTIIFQGEIKDLPIKDQCEEYGETDCCELWPI